MGRYCILRGKAAAAVMTVLFALAAALCLDPLTSVLAVVPLYYAAPVFLAFTFVYAGVLPGAVCLILASAGMSMLLGNALYGVIYYLPPLIVFLVMTAWRRPPHPWPAVALALAVALGQIIPYAMVQARFGGKAFQAFADAAARGIRGSELGDTLLYELNRRGLLELTIAAENAVTVRDGLYVLSDAARDNLLSNLILMLEATLEAMVPAMLVGFSLYMGALISAFPLGWGRRLNPRLEEERPLPEALMTPFRNWFIPRGHGWRFALMGAAGYLLINFGAPAVNMLGNILLQVFTAVFTIQGLAMLNYRQLAKGRPVWWRVLLPLILIWLLGAYLWLFGLADQVTDIRSLRGPKDRPENDQEEV